MEKLDSYIEKDDDLETHDHPQKDKILKRWSPPKIFSKKKKNAVG